MSVISDWREEKELFEQSRDIQGPVGEEERHYDFRTRLLASATSGKRDELHAKRQRVFLSQLSPWALYLQF